MRDSVFYHFNNARLAQAVLLCNDILPGSSVVNSGSKQTFKYLIPII